MGKMRRVYWCRRGFTLIELLVVVSIMALLSLTLISVFLATVRGGTKSQVVQRVHQEGDFAIQSMVRTIRVAESVSCSGDFTVTDLNGEMATFTEEVDGGVTKIASNSSEFLTSEAVEVSSLIFTCLTGDLGNQVVTIEFTLTDGGEVGAQAQDKFTQDFASSISTRTY